MALKLPLATNTFKHSSRAITIIITHPSQLHTTKPNLIAPRRRTLSTGTTTMTSTTTTTAVPNSFDLYTYFRSSCAARLRIALELKGIPYTPHFVNLLKGEQFSDQHKRLNPTATVPVLVAHYLSEPTGTAAGGGAAPPRQPDHEFTIGQSLAAMEFLEEVMPAASDNNNNNSGLALLPPLSDPQARARVRTVCGIIACEIQPVTNQRVQKRVKKLDADPTAWANEVASGGFEALEAVLEKTSGGFCVGEKISMADVCLVPAVWAAERVGVDVKGLYPVVYGVHERMLAEEAVKKAHWRNQPDTPEEFRW